MVESKASTFNVRTSPPVEAPKIHKKKVRVFVHLIRLLGDLILSSAHADEVPKPQVKKYPLTWEASDAQEFEIEIFADRLENKILTLKTTEPRFELDITKPGLYFWRIRARRDHLWSPFSDYNLVDAQDKIALLKTPLMQSPENQAVLEDNAEIKDVTFRWKNIGKDFTYTLELFNSPEAQKPFQTLKLKGTEQSLKFKNKEHKFWWRVEATSPYGQSSSNKERFEFTLKGEPSAFLRIDGAFAFESSSVEQKANDAAVATNFDRELDYTGNSLFLSGEYWHRGIQSKNGMRAGGRYASLGTGEETFKETEFFGEYLRVFNPFNLNLRGIIGYRRSAMEITYEDLSASTLSLNFLSLGVQSLHQIGEKGSLSFEVLLLPEMKLDFAAPTTKFSATYSHRFTERWAMYGFGEMRRLSFTSDDAYESSEVEFSETSTRFGLGFSWFR